MPDPVIPEPPASWKAFAAQIKEVLVVLLLLWTTIASSFGWNQSTDNAHKIDNGTIVLAQKADAAETKIDATAKKVDATAVKVGATKENGK